MATDTAKDRQEFARTQIEHMVDLMRRASNTDEITSRLLLQELKARLHAEGPFLEDRGTREYPDFFKKLFAANQWLEKEEWRLAAKEIESILADMLNPQGPESDSVIAFDRIIIGNLYFVLDTAGV